MDAASLQHILVNDWAVLENTPPAERRPAELHRWFGGVEHLAELVGERPQEVMQQLRSAARPLVSRRRWEMLHELAQDLAVARALGQDLSPPWHRRLDRLADVMGSERQRVVDAVEDAATAVEVTVQA
jgi:hypothetical protein